MTVERTAVLVLSQHAAKILSKVLTAHLDEYERLDEENDRIVEAVITELDEQIEKKAKKSKSKKSKSK